MQKPQCGTPISPLQQLQIFNGDNLTFAAEAVTTLLDSDIIRAGLESSEIIDWLAFEPGIAGIVAANDQLAYQIMDVAELHGWKAGRDYALIGFDDDAASLQRGLSSLRPPLEELGAAAAELLVKRFNGDRLSTQACLSSHLVARQSTLALKRE